MRSVVFAHSRIGGVEHRGDLSMGKAWPLDLAMAGRCNRVLSRRVVCRFAATLRNAEFEFKDRDGRYAITFRFSAGLPIVGASRLRHLPASVSCARRRLGPHAKNVRSEAGATDDR